MLIQLKKHSPFLVVMLLYFFSAITLAGVRPYWADEIYTLYIAETDSFSEILTLLGPMDPHPPIQYFLTVISHRLFGVNEITTRLPSVFMYGVFMMSTYVISFQLIGKKAAYFALVLSFLSVGIAYSYEARPYACVLGFLSLTYLCWLNYSRTKKN